MSTVRDSLKKFLGQEVEGCTATLSKRNGGRTGYGYLLTDVVVAGQYEDHCWFGGGEGRGCMRWDDLSLAVGRSLKFRAYIDNYYSQGSIRRGYDGYGVGIAWIGDVKVRDGRKWVPLKEWAASARSQRIRKSNEAKKAGAYVFPGSWAASVSGGYKVKAAASAPIGSKCRVSSKNGTNNAEVILTSFDETERLWNYEFTPAEVAARKKRQEEYEVRQAEQRSLDAERRDKERVERQKRTLFRKFVGLKSAKAREKYLAADPWLAQAEQEEKDRLQREERIEALRKQARELRRHREAEAIKLREAEHKERFEREAQCLANVFPTEGFIAQGNWTWDGRVFLLSGEETICPPPDKIRRASEIVLNRGIENQK
jgi:hypothetical protein